MSSNHWLVKTEPGTYSWDDLVREKRTAWTGVRNFQARTNLKAMREGDRVFVYHSGEGKEVVGIAKVVREAYPDATAKEGAWICVDLAPVEKLPRPVRLAEIKAEADFAEIPLVKNSRLSVQPMPPAAFDAILKKGKAG